MLVLIVCFPFARLLSPCLCFKCPFENFLFLQRGRGVSCSRNTIFALYFHHNFVFALCTYSHLGEGVVHGFLCVFLRLNQCLCIGVLSLFWLENVTIKFWQFVWLNLDWRGGGWLEIMSSPNPNEGPLWWFKSWVNCGLGAGERIPVFILNSWYAGVHFPSNPLEVHTQMKYFDYNKSLRKYKILNLFFNDIVGGWTHKGLRYI